MVTVKEFFDYAARAGLYSSPARLEYYCRQFFRGVPLEGRRLLDVGCGGGLLLTYARLAGARRCVGLEPEADGATAGSLGRLGRMLADLGVDGVEVRGERLQDYGPAPGAFEVVVMCNVINHLDQEACDRLPRDPAARRRYVGLLGEVARVLVPGGTLVLTDCGRINLFAPLTRLGLRHPFEPSITWERHQEPRVWVALLEEAGFRDPRVSWRVPNRLRALAGLLSNGLASRCLSSDFRIVARRAGPSREEDR